MVTQSSLTVLGAVVLGRGVRCCAMVAVWTVAVFGVKVSAGRAAGCAGLGSLLGVVATAPLLTWQGSLFSDSSAEPSVDGGFTGLVRHQLDGTAWVDVLPGWVAGADRLFQWVVDTASWREAEITIQRQRVLVPGAPGAL